MTEQMHQLALSAVLVSPLILFACQEKSPSQPQGGILHPECDKDPWERVDAHLPQSMVADWGQPIRLGEPINTPCSEDAIEIHGQHLYFMFLEDILDSLSPAQMLSGENNTYRAQRIGGPADFDQPVFFDLGQGAEGSLDGELSFTPDGQRIYFHSNRAANTGYQHDPPSDDYLDIYVADLIDGQPGPGRNLGAPVNTIYPDGEHALHPDGVTLYFTSFRPGGLGDGDIWRSAWQDSVWSEPINLGPPVNSLFKDMQPAFTADGTTMYFASQRNPFIGMAIYRSMRSGDSWRPPELVIQGIVGEPSLTADGQYLYFVHVLSDEAGNFDTDIWYCQRGQ